MAASLNDKAVLSLDTGFMQRVRTSMIGSAIAIQNDGLTGSLNASRHTLAAQIMNNPDGMKGVFSAAVATDALVIGDATVGGTVALTPITWSSATPPVKSGNVDTQAALVTDTHIDSAVSSMWNAFFAH